MKDCIEGVVSWIKGPGRIIAGHDDDPKFGAEARFDEIRQQRDGWGQCIRLHESRWSKDYGFSKIMPTFGALNNDNKEENTMSLKDFKGVVTGDAVQELFEIAKTHKFALPAVNVIGTDSIKAVMETAKAVNSPVIIQLSNGGAQFYAGKSMNNDGLKACVLGAVSAAHHVHLLAEHYGVAVILHTDHAARKLLPWIDGMLDHGEQFFKQHGKSLFSSHMLDLSEEPIEENIEISKKYLERMKP